jgi:hypothetical protein
VVGGRGEVVGGRGERLAFFVVGCGLFARQGPLTTDHFYLKRSSGRDTKAQGWGREGTITFRNNPVKVLECG